MKKTATLFIAVCLCLTVAFSGCGEATGYDNKLSPSPSGKVSSNGGFAVEKGEYVYFINGVAANSDSNVYGEVKTGALVRIKKSELSNTEAKHPEMVVPSLFVAGDKTAGFYIYGNEVYYASPVNTKNKEGKIENTKLNFLRTSLDGKNTHAVKRVDDNATSYRYVEKGSKVNLVLKTVNDKKESVITLVNAADGKEVITTGKIENMMFGDDLTPDVYYTKLSHNKQLDEDEKFNEIHRVTFDGKDELLLKGESLMGGGTGFGTMGLKFTLVKDTADTLYLKGEYVDTSMTKTKKYFAVKKADLKDAYKKDGEKTTEDGAVLSTNKNALVTINEGTKSADSVFAAASLYLDKNDIFYFDSSLGILKYDYETKDPLADEGRVVLSEDLGDLSKHTAKFWKDGYLYLSDSDNYYYRIKVIGGDNKPVKKEEMKLKKVNFLANASDWYLPEVTGDYFLSVYTAEPYGSLVYVSDMTKNAELKDDEIKEIRESKRESVEANLKTCISLLSEEKDKAVKKYLEDTFKDKKK